MKRLLSAAVAAVLCFGLVLGMSGTAQAATPASSSIGGGWWTGAVALSTVMTYRQATGVLRGQQSGRCVDVPGSSSANSTAVALWDCNGGANQNWSRS